MTGTSYDNACEILGITLMVDRTDSLCDKLFQSITSDKDQERNSLLPPLRSLFFYIKIWTRNISFFLLGLIRFLLWFKRYIAKALPGRCSWRKRNRLAVRGVRVLCRSAWCREHPSRGHGRGHGFFQQWSRNGKYLNLHLICFKSLKSLSSIFRQKITLPFFINKNVPHKHKY